MSTVRCINSFFSFCFLKICGLNLRQLFHSGYMIHIQSDVNCFLKTLHLRSFAEFWINLLNKANTFLYYIAFKQNVDLTRLICETLRKKKVSPILKTQKSLKYNPPTHDFTKKSYIFKQTCRWRWKICVNGLNGKLFKKFINFIKSRSLLNTLSIRSRSWYTTPSLLLSSTEQVYFHVCRNTHSYWPRNSEQITKGNEILKSQFN